MKRGGTSHLLKMELCFEPIEFRVITRVYLRKKKSKTSLEWTVREMHEVKEDVEMFQHSILKSLRHRLSSGVHKMCRTL